MPERGLPPTIGATACRPAFPLHKNNIQKKQVHKTKSSVIVHYNTSPLNHPLEEALYVE
jgi:hypothetical protein